MTIMERAATQTGYEDFLARKRIVAPATGREVSTADVHPSLFGFQAALVCWAVRKGRCALFTATGTGKTRMAVEWARLVGERTLIVAPLGVARQTVQEAAQIGVPVTYARNQADASDGITITNYEMAPHFAPEFFGAVVLDESSILKSISGKSRARLTEMFGHTPYRLCCTATPAPNDIAEIANHAEFLGVMRRVDMLASFFVHDECFVADTPIDTVGGPKQIKDIRPGDRILNAHGVDEVAGTSTKQVSALVEIGYNGSRVLCSANHPWFTTRGWVSAGDLSEGDGLVTQVAALRMVRDGVHGTGEEGRAQRALLQSILLGEMAHEPARLCGRSGHARKEAEAFCRDESLLRVGNGASRSAQRASTAVEADVASRGTREGHRDHETARSATACTAQRPMARWPSGRQRAWIDNSTSVTPRSFGSRLGSGGDDFLGQAHCRLSELLPRGSAASRAHDRGGDRRPVAQACRQARAGSQEGRLPGVVRVDSVALHQPGSPVFDRESGGRDTVTLYDLSVKHHPSFSVHGILVHNSGWRLKGHAAAAFYRWLASWAMAVRLPSDIGFSDDGYILPPLSVDPVWVEADYVPDGQLFFTDLHGITDRVRVRQGTVGDRVAAAARLVNASSEPWICWAGLNEESSALARAIPGAVEVVGSDSPEAKAEALAAFQDGRYRVLVSKASICGWGLNLQRCAHMVFVGLSDSFEAYYQCIRRCWRFGQTRPVHVYVVLSTHEDAIYANVMRKEEEAMAMSENLVAHVRDMERAELAAGDGGVQPAARDEASGEGWRLLLGDSVERMAELAEGSVDLTVTSPPFGSLFTYNPTERDVGNCRTPEEFRQHFAFVVDHLLRITKPGRLAAIHVQQIAAMLERDGYIGLKDFRGDVIRLFIDHGWIYHGEVCIDRDPQAQAIRTHSKGLLFVQLRKDASWMRPALPDHILLFRKSGENAVPVQPDVSNEEWIQWAHPVWYDVRESHTLNGHPARENDDERHICPLQLDTIARCIRLWSNPGETIFDPFAGVGSTLFQAVTLGRTGLGCELKRSYYETAARYLREAEAARHQPTLFDGLEPLPASASSSTEGAAR